MGFEVTMGGVEMGSGSTLNHGHRVAEGKPFICLDCGLSDVTAMQVQIVDCCPENPTGLCLAIWPRKDGSPNRRIQEHGIARASAEFWLEQAQRIPLAIEDVNFVEDDPLFCLTFTFKGERFRVRYGTRKAGHVNGPNAIRAEPFGMRPSDYGDF